MFGWLKKQNKPKTLGQLGEELAQEEYKKRGCKVIAANFFNKKGKRLGEIDFIAKDKQHIIFVEVKTRTRDYSRFGTAAESVDRFKQIKLLKAVKVFLLGNPEFAKLKPQIDVCIIRITDASQLKLVQMNPVKYLAPKGIDKIGRDVKMIPDAVEDWN